MKDKPIKLHKQTSKRKKAPDVVIWDGPKVTAVRLKEAYAAFLHWSVITPQIRRAEGLPKTQKAFCQLWKMEEHTPIEWKRRPDFHNEQIRVLQSTLNEETPGVMWDLRKRIKKYGMGLDIELWLAYVEGWDKKKVLEMRESLQFNDDDMRALLGHLPKEKQKEFNDLITKLFLDAEAAKAKELAR